MTKSHPKSCETVPYYKRFFQEVAYHKPELLKDPKTGEKVFSRQNIISFFPKRTVRFFLGGGGGDRFKLKIKKI
jgi:hypothetical protein